jgi:hypothetical protein
VQEWEQLMWNLEACPAKPGEKWILMESIYKFEAQT